MSDAKKQIILAVDDEPDLLEIMTFMIENAGFEVLTASNSNEALDLVKKNNISVIVSDVRMPGGDGIHLLDNINKAAPPTGLPVILVTGYADSSEEEMKTKGAKAVMSKPIDFSSLIKTINQYAQTPQTT